MQTRSVLALAAFGAAMLASSASFAGPEEHHPNIVAARDAAQVAIDKMKAAQAANEYDMNGHAAKAEKLLHEAQEEMKKAAETANKK